MKKKVLLITTGGTIASKETKNGMLDSGALNAEELTRLFDLPKEIELVVIDLFQIPSMHMDFDKMVQLRDTIINKLLDTNICGVVVTHGTDSLEETAYFLDLTIDDSRPIVVTGSQRSPQEIGTDSNSNLRNSIYVASSDISEGLGTVVVFNDRIYSAKYVKKVHASNLQGFESFGYGYLGIIDNNVVSVYQKPIKRDTYNYHKQMPRVDIIKCYTGQDGIFIDAAVLNGAKGIILEGVGRGQITPNMIKSVDVALSKGVCVVITTSAEEGKVFPAYDYEGSSFNMLKKGVILGLDYDSKKARIKLAILLSTFEVVDHQHFNH